MLQKGRDAMTEDIGNIVIAPQVKILTAKLSAARPTPPPGVIEAPEWIAQAQKYVSEDANNVASINSSIDQDPVLKGHPALMARQCVAAYNELPPDLRRMKERPQPEAAIARDDLAAMAACVEHASTAYNWWGFTTYMNDCLVNDLVATTAGAAAIAGIIAAVCPPCSVVAGIIAGVFALYAAWLQWADQHCGNRGAYWNATWNGVIWISTVC